MPQGFIGVAIAIGIDPDTDSDTDAEKKRQTKAGRDVWPSVRFSTSLTHYNRREHMPGVAGVILSSNRLPLW